jgi:hypothetical protein
MSQPDPVLSAAIGEAASAAIIPLTSLMVMLVKHSTIPKQELADELRRLIVYAGTQPNAPVLKDVWENMLAAVEGRDMPHHGS